jgi:hypothetical protein
VYPMSETPQDEFSCRCGAVYPMSETPQDGFSNGISQCCDMPNTPDDVSNNGADNGVTCLTEWQVSTWYSESYGITKNPEEGFSTSYSALHTRGLAQY